MKRFSLQAFWGWLGGKSFLVIMFFGISGFFLAWHGKLDGSYAALATSLSGFHVGRAVMQDINGDSSK